jgi:hypothetical protein
MSAAVFAAVPDRAAWQCRESRGASSVHAKNDNSLPILICYQHISRDSFEMFLALWLPYLNFRITVSGRL